MYYLLSVQFYSCIFDLDSCTDLLCNCWLVIIELVSGICLVRMVELTACDSNQLIPNIAIKIEAPEEEKLKHFKCDLLFA